MSELTAMAERAFRTMIDLDALYQERLAAFEQLTIALCTGVITYEELDTTEEEFGNMREELAASPELASLQ